MVAVMNNNIKDYKTEEFSSSVEKRFDTHTHAIAARVRHTLKKNNWTAEEFAEMMGIPTTTAYEWMSGAFNLTTRQIIMMELVLGINLTSCESVPEKESDYLDDFTEKQIVQAIKVYKVKHDMTKLAEQQWLSKYLTLIDFFKENGHANFPTNSKNQISMGYWINKQRETEKRGKLDFDKKELLKLINFNFSLRITYNWEDMYAKLIAFKFEHGHVHITPSIVDESLYDWLLTQKSSYWNGKLEYDKLRRLRKIGINMRHQTINSWNEKFAELKKFKREHGHMHISLGNGASNSLERFASQQRMYKNTMPKDRKRRLDRLGFEWELDSPWSRSINRRSHRLWLTHYEELREYKEEYGTSYVSLRSETHKSLGVWVSEQRKRRKDLKPEQIELLREIDFFQDNGIDF
ncbi:helix-turn-helix domain-containing protein [Puteibacter caeruleilacunae]|nr:helix-turn-helix domain-containing protein [Puteibacter caeruleilacunae]